MTDYNTEATIELPQNLGGEPLEGTFNDIEVTWVAGTVEGEGVGGGTLVRNVPFLVRTDG